MQAGGLEPEAALPCPHGAGSLQEAAPGLLGGLWALLMDEDSCDIPERPEPGPVSPAAAAGADLGQVPHSCQCASASSGLESPGSQPCGSAVGARRLEHQCCLLHGHRGDLWRGLGDCRLTSFLLYLPLPLPDNEGRVKTRLQGPHPTTSWFPGPPKSIQEMSMAASEGRRAVGQLGGPPTPPPA